MKTNVKYFEDTFCLKYYFLFIFPLIITISFYFHFVVGKNKMELSAILISLIVFIIPIILFHNFKNKRIAIDEKGNISLSGSMIDNFKVNTYCQTKSAKHFQFNKDNIKTVALVDYKTISRENILERLYLSRTLRFSRINST